MTPRGPHDPRLRRVRWKLAGLTLSDVETACERLVMRARGKCTSTTTNDAGDDNAARASRRVIASRLLGPFGMAADALLALSAHVRIARGTPTSDAHPVRITTRTRSARASSTRVTERTLAKEVAARTHLSKEDSAKLVAAVFATVAEALRRGETVTLPGFG